MLGKDGSGDSLSLSRAPRRIHVSTTLQRGPGIIKPTCQQETQGPEGTLSCVSHGGGGSTLSEGKVHPLRVTCVLGKPFQKPTLVRPKKQLSCGVGLTGYAPTPSPASSRAQGQQEAASAGRNRISTPTIIVMTTAPDGGGHWAQGHPGGLCALPGSSPASSCWNLGRFLPLSSHL